MSSSLVVFSCFEWKLRATEHITYESTIGRIWEEYLCSEHRIHEMPWLCIAASINCCAKLPPRRINDDLRWLCRFTCSPPLLLYYICAAQGSYHRMWWCVWVNALCSFLSHCGVRYVCHDAMEDVFFFLLHRIIFFCSPIKSVDINNCVVVQTVQILPQLRAR